MDFASVLGGFVTYLNFQSEYELQCNEVLGWRRRAPTVEGFTKEVKIQSRLFFYKIAFARSVIAPSTIFLHEKFN